MAQREQNKDIKGTLRKRIGILDEHIEQLEQQVKRLVIVKAIAYAKRTFYFDMLQEKSTETINDESSLNDL